MIKPIEQEFYKAFDIPTRPFITDGIYPEIIDAPPPITDRRLLELIVANNKNAPAVGDTLEELREQVLYWCIEYKAKIYHEVRKIMGVEEKWKNGIKGITTPDVVLGAVARS